MQGVLAAKCDLSDTAMTHESTAEDNTMEVLQEPWHPVGFYSEKWEAPGRLTAVSRSLGFYIKTRADGNLHMNLTSVKSVPFQHTIELVLKLFCVKLLCQIKSNK